MAAGGSSDPYAVLSLGVARAQTGVKKKTLDPLWNERLVLDADFFSEARHATPPNAAHCLFFLGGFDG